MSKHLPARTYVGSERKPYVLTVWIVRHRNADGSPALLELLREGDVAHLDRGEDDFVTAYLPREVMDGREPQEEGTTT